MPKVIDAEKQKARIAKATWTVISTLGIQSVSMRRVALKANCTTGLITHYFSDKDQLVTFAYAHALEKMLAEARERIATEDSFLEKIHLAIEAIEPISKVMKELTIVMINFWAQAAINPKFAAQCESDYRAWYVLLMSIIEEGIKNGELSNDVDRKALTDTITLYSDGLSVGMTLTPKRYTQKYRKTILKRLLAPYMA